MKSYEKEYRHCLENSNKMELVDKIIYDEKEIGKLTAESTEWESRFYDEAKKVDKAIKLLEEARENIDLPWYDRQHLIEKTINELRGENND